MDKQLKDKAITIQGKQYVQVADRIKYFNDTYPNGSIRTTIVADDGKNIIMTAIAIPDTDKPERYFTGTAEEVRGTFGVNKTSAVENCETSCIGRCLAVQGIGVIDSVASVDEINIAKRKEIQLDEINLDKDFDL